MSVSLREARGSRADRDWIQRTYREYLDDLSSANTGLFPALPEAGYRETDVTLAWFRDERSVPLVILRGGVPAGFARVVCTRPGPAPARPQFQLVDFFIQSPHRGLGVGRQAATLIFSRFAGDWLVTEETRHPGAVQFWRKVVAAFTRGRYTERVSGAEVRHRFVSAGQDPAAS